MSIYIYRERETYRIGHTCIGTYRAAHIGDSYIMCCSDRRRLLKPLLCVPCIYNRTTSRTTGQDRSQPVTTSPTSSHRQSAHVSLLVLASCATGPYHSYVVLGDRAMVARLVVRSVGNRSSTGGTTGLTMGLLG